MKVTAKLNNLRIAPRKVRLVTNLIKGLDTQDALNQLDSTVKGACLPVKKLLESAVANGENNFGLDKNNLYISEAKVEEGVRLKRWMPRAFGRASQILKRTSKIIITLEERVEGKGRKTKEQMEKEKKARLAKKRKAEKAAEQEEKSEEKKETNEFKKEAEKETGKKGAQSGWTNKIFRRKSM